MKLKEAVFLNYRIIILSTLKNQAVIILYWALEDNILLNVKLENF